MKIITYGVGLFFYTMSCLVQAQQPPLSNGPLFWVAIFLQMSCLH